MMFTRKKILLCLSLSTFIVSDNLSAATNEKIETIEVVGRAQQYYLETESKIGTKTDLSLLELPQSAQVLTEQLIIDQAARDITDLYRSIAGVSEFRCFTMV